MTQDEIIEGNRVIAEFDGKKWRPVKAGYTISSFSAYEIEFGTFQECFDYCQNEINKYLKHPDEMYFALPKAYNFQFEYHSSWDWLMPVVEKIEKLGFKVAIEESGCVIFKKYGTPINTTWNWPTKKEGVYQAVLGFIKWHNQLSK